MYTLYGDGIHDDTSAIQEMLDSGKSTVSLPEPENFYVISRSLIMRSNTGLILPRFAEIRLADDSNCAMVTTADEPSCNIELSGGIWNCNNMGQKPNPIQSRDWSIPGFFGFGMFFKNITNFKISSLTMKDPTNFAITLDNVKYFTVEDIAFDFNNGNPRPINMDGIHCNGNCHYGVIQNLKGACYDDLVALNADEGSCGPITNIQIDGLFSENCHSAVRLLSRQKKVENIHISNVFGTFYQYCVGITKESRTNFADCLFDAITLEGIYASKAPHDPKIYSYSLPFIYFEAGVIVKNFKIANMHRKEQNDPVCTISIGKETKIDRLVLDNVTTENHTGNTASFIKNEGTVRQLILRDVSVTDDEKITDSGVIEDIKEF